MPPPPNWPAPERERGGVGDVRGTGGCLVLTHGSWTDATGWEQAAARLSERCRVVAWDRRGHTRSEAGSGPGSRAEDAADLAGLIEQVSTVPVHVVGNSYGANVTLTLVTTRPDLIASAAVHEPPLCGLLEGTRDQALVNELATADVEIGVVRDRIISGDHSGAAEHFVEHVALGPGMWEQLPDASQLYYTSLLRFFGCTADAAATASAVGGDEAAFYGAMAPVSMGSNREQLRTITKICG